MFTETETTTCTCGHSLQAHDHPCLDGACMHCGCLEFAELEEVEDSYKPSLYSTSTWR